MARPKHFDYTPMAEGDSISLPCDDPRADKIKAAAKRQGVELKRIKEHNLYKFIRITPNKLPALEIKAALNKDDSQNESQQ